MNVIEKTTAEQLIRHPIVIVWFLLMLATAISWVLGINHNVITANQSVVAAILIGISFLKVHLIGRYFMDLKYAPPVLRLVFDSWVVVTSFSVIGFYIWA